MSVATGQAPAARVVTELAYDAFTGHDIDEIPHLDRARTIAGALIPGANRFGPARRNSPRRMECLWNLTVSKRSSTQSHKGLFKMLHATLLLFATPVPLPFENARRSPRAVESYATGK